MVILPDISFKLYNSESNNSFVRTLCVLTLIPGVSKTSKALHMINNKEDITSIYIKSKGVCLKMATSDGISYEIDIHKEDINAVLNEDYTLVIQSSSMNHTKEFTYTGVIEASL